MATNTMPKPGYKTARWAVEAGLWALQFWAAYKFLRSGSSKLLGAPMMVHIFQTIGLGQWFRYLTGTLEVLGAVGLLIPGASGYAATLLMAVMAGAITAHLVVLGGSPAAAAELLAAMALVAWGRLRRRQA